MVHLCSGVADDLDILRKKTISVQAKKGWEGLLLCQIAGGTQDDNDGIVLELDGSALRLASVQIARDIQAMPEETSPAINSQDIGFDVTENPHWDRAL